MGVMIARKLKICVACNTPQYIWAYGTCKRCSVGNYKPLQAIKKKKPIPKMSDKGKLAIKAYLKVRLEFLNENPMCKVCSDNGITNSATEVHHKKGRLGSLLTDTRYFLPICRSCHWFIERNPEKSKQLGYSLDRLSKE